MLSPEVQQGRLPLASALALLGVLALMGCPSTSPGDEEATYGVVEALFTCELRELPTVLLAVDVWLWAEGGQDQIAGGHVDFGDGPWLSGENVGELVFSQETPALAPEAGTFAGLWSTDQLAPDDEFTCPAPGVMTVDLAVDWADGAQTVLDLADGTSWP